MKFLALTMFLASVDSQWVWIALTLGQWVYNIGSGIFIRRLAAQNKKIAALERELETRADAYMTLRFSGLTAELKQSIVLLVEQVKQLNRRVDESDGDIENMGERDHRMELMLERQTRDLKDWMHESFASKEDLQRIDTRLDGLNRPRH